jgi:hypothetical protein
MAGHPARQHEPDGAESCREPGVGERLVVAVVQVGPTAIAHATPVAAKTANPNRAVPLEPVVLDTASITVSSADAIG